MGGSGGGGGGVGGGGGGGAGVPLGGGAGDRPLFGRACLRHKECPLVRIQLDLG